MATTTADMQQIQATTGNAVSTGQSPAETASVSTNETQSDTTGNQGGMLANVGSGNIPSLKDILAQPAVKKATPAIMIGVLMLFFFATYMAVQEPVYRPVFPGMNDADRQSAMDALKEGGFSPQLNRETGQLEVDASAYHEARIYLAAQGLPSEGTTSDLRHSMSPRRLRRHNLWSSQLRGCSRARAC